MQPPQPPISASRSGNISRIVGSSGPPVLPKRPDPYPKATPEGAQMRRIKRGWALTKKSWALLNGHRELIRFPLYGAVATTLLAIVTLGPGLYLWEEDQMAGAIPIIVIGVYVLSFVGFYFSVGLAAC